MSENSNLSYFNSLPYLNGEPVYPDVVDTRKPATRFEFARLKAFPGKNLLDIGCGDGQMLRCLNDKYESLHGVDVSEHRINAAKKFLSDKKYNFRSGNFGITETYQENFFDTILCLDVIAYFLDVRGALKETFRILRPKGQLILTTPNVARIDKRINFLFGKFPSTSAKDEGLTPIRKGEVLLDGGQLHYFTFRSMTKLLAEAGFTEIQPFGFGRKFFLSNKIPKLFSGAVGIVAGKQ